MFTVVSGLSDKWHMGYLSKYMCAKLLQLCLLVTLWTVACQAPLSQARILEWLLFPSPGDLPDQEIKPKSLNGRILYHQCHGRSPSGSMC